MKITLLSQMVCANVDDKVKKYGDAPSNVRRGIRKFNVAHVDWKWENIEDAIWNVLEVYTSLQARFDPGVFKTDSAMNASIQDVVESAFFVQPWVKARFLCLQSLVIMRLGWRRASVTRIFCGRTRRRIDAGRR